MKNCDENQNLMSIVKNMFILCTDVYLNICNIRPCFMAFSSCCKRKIFSMQAQFRVYNALLPQCAASYSMHVESC